MRCAVRAGQGGEGRFRPFRRADSKACVCFCALGKWKCAYGSVRREQLPCELQVLKAPADSPFSETAGTSTTRAPPTAWRRW